MLNHEHSDLIVLGGIGLGLYSIFTAGKILHLRMFSNATGRVHSCVLLPDAACL